MFQKDGEPSISKIGPMHFIYAVPFPGNLLCSLKQGSEVPSLGTFSRTLSGKWAKVGKMGENGGK